MQVSDVVPEKMVAPETLGEEYADAVRVVLAFGRFRNNLKG